MSTCPLFVTKNGEKFLLLVIKCRWKFPSTWGVLGGKCVQKFPDHSVLIRDKYPCKFSPTVQEKYVVFGRKSICNTKLITCQQQVVFCQTVKHMAKVKIFTLLSLELFVFDTGPAQINDNFITCAFNYGKFILIYLKFYRQGSGLVKYSIICKFSTF